jgi:hypothetical protein
VDRERRHGALAEVYEQLLESGAGEETRMIPPRAPRRDFSARGRRAPTGGLEELLGDSGQALKNIEIPPDAGPIHRAAGSEGADRLFGHPVLRRSPSESRRVSSTHPSSQATPSRLRHVSMNAPALKAGIMTDTRGVGVM